MQNTAEYDDIALLLSLEADVACAYGKRVHTTACLSLNHAVTDISLTSAMFFGLLTVTHKNNTHTFRRYPTAFDFTHLYAYADARPSTLVHDRNFFSPDSGLQKQSLVDRRCLTAPSDRKGKDLVHLSLFNSIDFPSPLATYLKIPDIHPRRHEASEDCGAIISEGMELRTEHAIRAPTQTRRTLEQDDGQRRIRPS